MQEIDWAQALGVFVFGFGGVFVCLLMLTAAIQISSALIRKFFDEQKTQPH
jgi:Na+-transporting methylmalonyl-CoA/oxaloacetate decarboxylase gamma subunit